MIEKEDVERVRILRLNRPPSNVLNMELWRLLAKEAAAAASDPQVRCLVIASKLPKYFSTGLDLPELTALPAARQDEPFKAMVGVYRALRELEKPTLACMGGAAILGGWILAMGCDFRYLSDDGKIALSEIRFGVSPTPLLIQRLKEISCSPSLVKDMVLRGKTLRAEEALAGGFVDRVVASAELEAEALKDAKSLGKSAPGAYAAIKRALSRRATGDAESLIQESLAEFTRLFTSPEAQEGIVAQRDKRKPRWEA